MYHGHMAKKKKALSKTRKTLDINEMASQIVAAATRGQFQNGKNPLAVALGRMGGKKGGKARAEKLSSERRKEIALKAARARWDKTNA
jgi:RNase adaptor protein for sRNA GlmZ degradation